MLPPLDLKRIRLHPDHFDNAPFLWNSLFQSVDMVRQYYADYLKPMEGSEPFLYFSDGTVEFCLPGEECQRVIDAMGTCSGKMDVTQLVTDENGSVYDKWFEIIKTKRFACGRGGWDEQFMKGLDWLAPLWFVHMDGLCETPIICLCFREESEENPIPPFVGVNPQKRSQR